MRVTLVNPPIDTVLSRGHVRPVTAHLFYNSPPLGLLYVAAALEQAGHEVAFIDAAAEELDVEATARRVAALAPDLVAMGSTTVVFETTRLLASALRRLMPGVPRVLGGYHVTLSPASAMIHSEFDIGVLGEAEATLPELCEAVRGARSLGSVRGIVFRQADGALCFTEERAPPRRLDALPFPARQLVRPALYRPLPVDQRGTPKFTIVTSRGCPHACVFCQEAGTGYRVQSPAAIVDELEHLVRDFGARDVAIVDSLFCVSRRRVEAILDEIQRRGVSVSWTCTARVDTVDLPLLRRMREAGCWRVRFGLESGSDRVLDFVSKGITKAMMQDAVGAADLAGLRPKAFFMVGHMPDTHESINETIQLAKALPLHDVTVQINTILPHTPQMELWRREGARWGRLVHETTDQTSGWEPTFVPWGLEAADLLAYHRKFYREFYLRRATLARHLESTRTLADVVKVGRAAGLLGFLLFDVVG